jgi:hypothetical protein
MKKQSPRPSKPQDGPLYSRTDISPEEVFQAIGRLRKEAQDEIDRLIRFFDRTDDYVLREMEDDGDDREDSADAEPSLGSFDQLINQENSWRFNGADIEVDDCDLKDDDPAEVSEVGHRRFRWSTRADRRTS